MLSLETMAIHKVCFEFCVKRNQQKGKKILIGNSELNITSFNFDTIVYDNNPARSLLNQDIYPYTLTHNEGKVFFNKIKVAKVFEPICYSVSVKGKMYYKSIQRELNNTGNKLKICDCLSIYCDAKTEQTTFYFDTKGTIDSIIYDTNFIIDFISEKELYIEDILVSLTSDIDCEKVLTNTVNIAKLFGEIKYVLDYLGIKTTKKYENFTEDDLRVVGLLIDILINRTGEITSHKDGIAAWKVLGCDILVMLAKGKDGSQLIFNYFNLGDRLRIVPNGVDPSNADNTIPVYYNLKSDTMLKYSNFDLSNFEKSIYQCGKNKYSDRCVDLMLLEIIHCYDKSLNKVYLEAGSRIVSHLQKENGNSVINDINELQIKKRTNELSSDDKKRLIALRDKVDNDLMILAALNILLDNFTDVELALEKMDVELKEIFQNYPIFALFEKRLQTR